MNNYAMVCNGVVIEVIYNCSQPPNWPPDPEGNPIIAIPCADNVLRGMRYDEETGEFLFVETFEEIIIEKLTETEERQIDILLNTEYIACLLESQLA